MTIDHLRSVVGCVTHSRLVRRERNRKRPATVSLWLTRAPISAPAPFGPCSIDVTVELGSGSTVDASGAGSRGIAYEYALLDRNGTELPAHHWHTSDRFAGPDHPHVHVSAALRPARPNGDRAGLPLDKLHLAIGLVSLAAFVRVLVEEFGVRPLAAD